MEGKELDKHLFVLILCGGGGTRLWPRSRKKTPKQFLANFFGKETIFTRTVKRAQLLTTNDKIFVITYSDYVDEVLAQGKVISPRNIIAEPVGKNTAMAMGVGAAYIKKQDPEAIIINLASDQLIENEPIFVREMLLAVKAARSGDYIVTVGIKPTFPHTGLGYIESGEDFGSDGVKKVIRFKEKPDFETAKSFLQAGNFFWNANLYVWSVPTIWGAFKKREQDRFQLLEKIFDNIGKPSEEANLQACYQKATDISIDFAVSEKADNLILVPGTFRWSDIGDWGVVYELKKKDADGNVVESFGDSGWHFALDTKNCLVETENRFVATIGISDLIIVEKEDCVLICSRKKAQDVKKVVEELKKTEKKHYL